MISCIKNGHLWVSKPLMELWLCAYCNKLREDQNYT